MEEITQQFRYYLPAIKKMRMILMMCAILFTYGLHSSLGSYNVAIFAFAYPALFIISGYAVLRESQNTEKRILRAIKRTAICFAILFAVYLGLSFLVAKEATFAAVTSKAFWVDFLLLNIWPLPIGSTIWYVQAILYAYIIIYVIYKLKLLKFDIYIAALCLVVTLLTGELSALVGFRFLGHTYLVGNFLTRALPYILIGCFIGRKEPFFCNLKVKHYWLLIIVGIVLSVAECIILVVTKNIVYIGHLFGMGLVAVGISFFAVLMVGMGIKSKILVSLSRCELMIPYFVASPVYYLCHVVFMSFEKLGYLFGNFKGIVTLIISFLILYIYAIIRNIIMNIAMRKYEKAMYESAFDTGSDEQ